MESLTLFSSIKKELLQQQLMRGSAIAGVGAMILIFGGIWVPQASLVFWGLPMFLVGIGLVTWGMVPYRHLKQIESTPYVVKVDGNALRCFLKGKEAYCISLQSIGELTYIDDERKYGINIALKPPEKGCLFLPYFSKRSYQELLEAISEFPERDG